MNNLVIGQSGFIGKSIYSNVENPIIFKPKNWEIPNFMDELKKISDANKLRIFWATGVSNNTSTKFQLEQEINLVKAFFEAIKLYKIKIDQINLISSAGSLYAGTNNQYINEHSEPMPISHYGKSRLDFENAFKVFSISNEIILNVFRLTNVFGYKHKINQNSGVINNLINANIKRKPINIFVSLFVKQDYIDIDFVVKNLCHISYNSSLIAKEFVRVFVLSRNYSHSIQEIISIIERITKKRTPYVMQFDPNTKMRNSNLSFKISNEEFIKFKIQPIEFQIKKLITNMINVNTF